MRSELLFFFKHQNTMPMYDMLVQSPNTCLQDIYCHVCYYYWSLFLYSIIYYYGCYYCKDVFAGKCEKKGFAIFENFPAVQGPAQEGFMLDFLGRLSKVCSKPLALLVLL